MLGHFKREALRVLADCGRDAGLIVRRISERSTNSYSYDNARQRSGALVAALADLEELGLVRKLDGEKPVVWVITDLGREALSN